MVQHLVCCSFMLKVSARCCQMKLTRALSSTVCTYQFDWLGPSILWWIQAVWWKEGHKGSGIDSSWNSKLLAATLFKHFRTSLLLWKMLCFFKIVIIILVGQGFFTNRLNSILRNWMNWCLERNMAILMWYGFRTLLCMN